MVIVAILENSNILDHKGVICHQCNCVTKRGRGLSQQIFNKFPYANVYLSPIRIPGTIEIRESGNQVIIALYAQHNPGRNTTNEPRLKWFEKCLNLVSQYYKDVAIPYAIVGGGNIADYHAIMSKSSLNIILYKL